jgi:hypothetical protein
MGAFVIDGDAVMTKAASQARNARLSAEGVVAMALEVLTSAESAKASREFEWNLFAAEAVIRVIKWHHI